tara:strand:+ start:1121 stop:2077 length:957 start_codon:yes stop_codon:yes gene_type:complete
MKLNPLKNTSSNTLAKKQKIKLFLIFVLISTLFWTSTKFSKNYSSLISFKIEYQNTPELVIIESSNQNIELYINTSGFQLLLYKIFPRTLYIDASLASFKRSKAEIDLSQYRGDIEEQINGTFISFGDNILSYKYSILSQKKYKVIPNINLTFLPGYNFVNDWKITPDCVLVSGPKSKLDRLNYIKTEFVIKKEVSENIYQSTYLINPDSLLIIKPNNVLVERTIKRFTEKELNLPINVTNLPKDINIKLFPESVLVKFSFPIEFVEEINHKDFMLNFDFQMTENGKFKSLPLTISKFPEMAKNIRWIPQTISYLIKK